MMIQENCTVQIKHDPPENIIQENKKVQKHHAFYSILIFGYKLIFSILFFIFVSNHDVSRKTIYRE